MSWLDETQFRNLYVTASATEIGSEQIGQCLDEAIDRLADLCGDAVVTEIQNGDNELRKAKTFRRAQGKFAYAALLLLMSARFRSGGILVKESDANASTTDEYAGVTDIEKRRAVLIKEATEAVAFYITPAEKVKDESFIFPSISMTKKITW